MIQTRFVYAATGELLEVRQRDPANATLLSTFTRFSYDSLGRKTRQIDALGRATRFDYTVRGELASRTRPMGQQESFVYDDQGNLETRVDFMGRSTTYAYNGLNLVRERLFHDGTAHAFTYFPGGQRSGFTMSAGGVSATTSFILDGRNRLITQINPDTTVISWEYDAAGNRTAVTAPTPRLKARKAATSGSSPGRRPPRRRPRVRPPP